MDQPETVKSFKVSEQRPTVVTLTEHERFLAMVALSHWRECLSSVRGARPMCAQMAQLQTKLIRSRYAVDEAQP